MASFRKRGKAKVWSFRHVSTDGRKVESAGCEDLLATRAMAREAESRVARERAGLLDPREVALAGHEATLLVNHLDDWHSHMIAKGSTKQHADLSRNRALKVVAVAKLNRIGDLSPSKVQAALKAIRDGGVSLRSQRHYTRCVGAFGRWLWKDGRAREHVLAHLVSPNPDAERPQRAPRPERRRVERIHPRGGTRSGRRQTHRAGSGDVVPTRGRDRVSQNELRSLAPKSFDLESEPPIVTVKAGYSKRGKRSGRDDHQPIRPDLADALRPWIASKPPGRPVFSPLTKHTAEMMRADLAAAASPTATPRTESRTSIACGTPM